MEHTILKPSELPEAFELAELLKLAGLDTLDGMTRKGCSERIFATRESVKEASVRTRGVYATVVSESDASLASIGVEEILLNLLEHEVWGLDRARKEKLLQDGEYERFAKNREGEEKFLIFGYFANEQAIGIFGFSESTERARSSSQEAKKASGEVTLGGYGQKIISHAFPRSEQRSGWRIWIRATNPRMD